MYGCRPRLVGVRCVRRAYGISADTALASWPHPLDPVYSEVFDHEDDHVPYVRETFSKLVAMGESVGFLEVKRSKYHPAALNVTGATIDIYCTEDNSVVYTKHPAMRKLGRVVLKLPEGWSKGMTIQGRKNYALEVAFQFGTTELRVTATNKQTGQAFETAVTYE